MAQSLMYLMWGVGFVLVAVTFVALAFQHPSVSGIGFLFAGFGFLCLGVACLFKGSRPLVKS